MAKNKSPPANKAESGDLENQKVVVAKLASSEGPRQAKVKVRYTENKQVKDMRLNFERMEKHAMRSSRTYRYNK